MIATVELNGHPGSLGLRPLASGDPEDEELLAPAEMLLPLPLGEALAVSTDGAALAPAVNSVSAALPVLVLLPVSDGAVLSPEFEASIELAPEVWAGSWSPRPVLVGLAELPDS